MTLHGNKFTDSHTKRPQPQGVGKFVVTPTPDELKRIRKGHRQGFCYEYELSEVMRKARDIAVSIKAKSWTMFPILEDSQRRLIVEFYNWPETGIYNFEHPVSSNKRFYWWFKAELPEWWNDPKWKHVAEEHQKHYDPRD